MLSAGSGPQSIELEEASSTIEQFLDIVTTGDFSLTFSDESKTSTTLVELSRPAKFLRKYDCPVALSILRNNVRYRTDVPLIALLLVEIPDTPRYFIKGLDSFACDENRLWIGSTPPNASIKPKNVPLEAFAELPIQYHWALRQARVGNLERSAIQGGNNQLMSPGERFKCLLEMAKASGFGP